MPSNFTILFALTEILFWFSSFFVIYAYFGYPMALALLARFRQRPVSKGNISPPVSFVIAAHNEEERLRDKIENTLALDYPGDKLEIIIASDCSTDGTDDIVQQYHSRGVRLVRSPERKGKEAAQERAVGESTGEILVFSDVATTLLPDALSKIVSNFNDPGVGCVSSVDRFVESDGTVSGESAYVRYEMFLRNLESRVNTLVGLSGSFFAARREVCEDWASDLQSDFNSLLNCVKKGLRGVSDPESVGIYTNLADEKREFDRKVRTVVRGISVFMNSLTLINPLRYGLFTWQLLSHKLCRWLVPFAMISALVTNHLLAYDSMFYLTIAILQDLFYLIAFLGIQLSFLATARLFKLPSFFVLVNLAILSAWFRYLRGQRSITWDPSKRPV